ncbi:MAG: hypothetical protein H6835_15860 [Planctomycetes bacterium]|nr:hypothetical protein [Planctomycetota bacterium]
MQASILLGATALVAATVLFWSQTTPVAEIHVGAPRVADATPAVPTVSQPAMPAPPQADGHYVLVVEGDRTALAVTTAVAKSSPWAGAPKGLTSTWRLTIRDAAAALLADVPLDVSPFDTDAAALGRPVQVTGDEVRDARIGMLVNAPRFAAAASYTFSRPVEDGSRAVIGQVSGAAVRELAGETR